jgi:hypothetical protein
MQIPVRVLRLLQGKPSLNGSIRRTIQAPAAYTNSVVLIALNSAAARQGCIQLAASIHALKLRYALLEFGVYDRIVDQVDGVNQFYRLAIVQLPASGIALPGCGVQTRLPDRKRSKASWVAPVAKLAASKALS